MTTSSPSSASSAAAVNIPWQQFSHPPPGFYTNDRGGVRGGCGGGTSPNNVVGASLFRPMPHVSMTTPPPTPPYGGAPARFMNFMNVPPPPMPPIRNKMKQKEKFDCCAFCKNNGEDESYFMSHTLKDDTGKVVCPVLYNYECPTCHAFGPVAHTLKYCPQNRNGEMDMSNEMASITTLRRMRSSVGGPPRAILGQLGLSSTSGSGSGLPKMAPMQNMMHGTAQNRIMHRQQQNMLQPYSQNQQVALNFMRNEFLERGDARGMHYDNSRGSSSGSLGNSPAESPPNTPLHDVAVAKTPEDWKKIGKFFAGDF